ncbi:hypothetical protein CDV55_101527 [Aspergillus turcosus]|nr:hypothetical protein CDV55_101527 [Aspergillus turcosus]
MEADETAHEQAELLTRLRVAMSDPDDNFPKGVDSATVIGHGNALVLHDGAETRAARNAPDINGYALFGVPRSGILSS